MSGAMQAFLVRMLSGMSEADGDGIEVAGGFNEVEVDLSSTTKKPYNARGFALYFPRSLNSPQAALRVSFNGGGELTLTPGMAIRAPFRRFEAVSTGELAIGVATLVVARHPLLDLRWTDVPEDGVPTRVVVGPSGAATQALNTAQWGANAPVLATDGVSLRGAKGMRALVAGVGGGALATIQGNWWYWDPGSALWMPSTITTGWAATGQAQVSTEDNAVTVPYGRAYFEAWNATGPATSVAVTLQVF